jgi:hypothetical protein
MKIRLVEAELFRADRQTDRRDEAHRRSSQFFFVKAPKREGSYNVYSLYYLKDVLSFLITFTRFAFIIKNSCVDCINLVYGVSGKRWDILC